MKRASLLVLTTRFPYPLYGGDVLRIYRLCEALKDAWSITLASICQSRLEMDQELPPGNPFAEVHRVFLPKICSYFRVFGALSSNLPFQLAYYSSPRFARLTSELLLRNDAILCHLLRTAPYAGQFGGRRFLDMTDHLPLTYDRSNKIRGGLRSLLRLAYRIERDRIDLAQNHIARKFDTVSFVSEIDRSEFLESSRMSPDRVVTLPNGVSLEDHPYLADRSGSRLVFVGNLLAMPNADAVCYFVGSVLPLILRAHPATSLKVVGRVDRKVSRRLSRNGTVEFTGSVTSLADATRDCVIGLCPVRIGAGIQNKILDYMALGLATVTTSVGAEGLKGAAGQHYLVANSPTDYASAVISLLRDSIHRQRIALAARTLVAEHYSWSLQMKEAAGFFCHRDAQLD
jgi:glycosyltransferase involved in cell wall biosynthesis